MKLDPNQYHRRSVRLKGYDYSRPGAYFVTICSFNKECLFGQIVAGQMQLNDFGKIVRDEWLRSGDFRREIALGACVVMPNHLHGIVVITTDARPQGRAQGLAPLHLDGRRLARKPRSLASFIAGFKSASAGRINAMRNTPGAPVWQRNYYEHIVRNEDELNRIREYIATNPLRWGSDRENPTARPLPEDNQSWEV